MKPFGSISSGLFRHSNLPEAKSNSQYRVFHFLRVFDRFRSQPVTFDSLFEVSLCKLVLDTFLLCPREVPAGSPAGVGPGPSASRLGVVERLPFTSAAGGFEPGARARLMQSLNIEYFLCICFTVSVRICFLIIPITDLMKFTCSVQRNLHRCGESAACMTLCWTQTLKELLYMTLLVLHEDSMMRPHAFSSTIIWVSSASTSFGPTDPIGDEILKETTLSLWPSWPKSPTLISKYDISLRKAL